jgi:hypothetical protein
MSVYTYYIEISKQKCHVCSNNYYFFSSKYIARLLRKMKIESKKIINEDREQTDNTKDMRSQGLLSLYPSCI